MTTAAAEVVLRQLRGREGESLLLGHLSSRGKPMVLGTRREVRPVRGQRPLITTHGWIDGLHAKTKTAEKRESETVASFSISLCRSFTDLLALKKKKTPCLKEMWEEEQTYPIELHVSNKKSVEYVDIALEHLTDFESLEHLVCEYIRREDRGKTLKIVWKDAQENEILIESDADFRRSIDAQMSDEGLDCLRFFVSIEKKRRLSSAQVSSTSLPREGEGKEDQEKLLKIVRRWCAEAVKENRSPLFVACDQGDLEGVQALLQCTNDMVESESEDVKRFMRKSVGEQVNKVEIFRENCTPLHAALRRRRLDIISLLLENGADLEMKGESDQLTPLHIAAQEGKKECVSLLIANKADLEATNVIEMTPLCLAIERQEAEFVSFMVEQKSNLEAKDQNMWTPLHFAVNNDLTETASVLIALKADIEATNESLYTPLHVAAEERNADIVALLLQQKANLEAKNEFGQTPLQTTDDKKIKAMLRKAKENTEMNKASTKNVKTKEQSAAQARTQTRSRTRGKG